eukprot:6106369-Pyramimonas_sp.AAC.1
MPTSSQVEDLMRTHWHRMNGIHLVAALHNVAKAHSSNKNHSPLASVRNELLTKLQGSSASMDARGISVSLWSVAKLQLEPGAEFLADFEAKVLAGLDTFTHHDLSQTAWAFATLGHFPPQDWWNRFDASALRAAPTISPQVVDPTPFTRHLTCHAFRISLQHYCVYL